ncbi:hypothetical protein CEXT_558051 [Caerostris extrusa]|uniref:Secreted protein n=1 Tax=Caerostris extrusa TaxID=172846 RepID=A0AAV4PUK0_CAEEX|nr:hypothetical protein CEXT_558051 [Caerostris extrusa]
MKFRLKKYVQLIALCQTFMPIQVLFAVSSLWRGATGRSGVFLLIGPPYACWPFHYAQLKANRQWSQISLRSLVLRPSGLKESALFPSL